MRGEAITINNRAARVIINKWNNNEVSKFVTKRRKKVYSIQPRDSRFSSIQTSLYRLLTISFFAKPIVKFLLNSWTILKSSVLSSSSRRRLILNKEEKDRRKFVRREYGTLDNDRWMRSIDDYLARVSLVSRSCDRWWKKGEWSSQSGKRID